MKEITPSEVEILLNQGKQMNIIDVREAGEVAGGKIPGALNIPLGLIEFRKQDLNKDSEYIVVCHSGGRSSMAAQFLENQGFKVINMTGGMLGWAGKVE